MPTLRIHRPQVQKRRIYDITNVLEGIGIIEKKSKNVVQVKAQSAGTNDQEHAAEIEGLQAGKIELD